MQKDSYGQLIFNEKDLCNFLLQGKNLDNFFNMLVDDSVDIDSVTRVLNESSNLLAYEESDKSIEEFDHDLQSNWHMPQEYKDLDIAEYILSLCETQAELQRCGHELLLFQKKNLFDLLRYLKYLVDMMRENDIIWGVGRGSSVASYVLYKLGVHAVDSMYYDLKPEEFLR